MNTKLKLIQEHPEIKEAMWEFLNYKRFILVGRTEFEIKFQDFERSLEEKPLFITNGDNEEVFEGDEIYFMYPDAKGLTLYKINYERDIQHYHDLNNLGRTWFKNLDKATIFLIENARVLSIADYKGWDYTKGSFDEYFPPIVKQRLNLK